MIGQARKDVESKQLTLKLYDRMTRQRYNRPPLKIPKDKADLKELGLANFSTQLAEPRRKELQLLREVDDKISIADKVALLVMMSLPMLETSALLHKLSMQLAQDPEAVYFSKVNQSDNCGCGCGCGCAAMQGLPYEERIYAHYAAKPFSIDPFNEVGVSEKERDSLLIKDFLRSYEAFSGYVSERVNKRYFEMSREFE